MKITLFLLAAATLLAVAPVHADSRRGGAGGRGGNHGGNHGGRDFGRHGGGNFRHHGGGYHRGGGGRFYYYGGAPYFYPYTSIGFGDPYWYGGFDDPYYGGVDDRYYGYLRPYEGHIVDETSPERLKAMKNGRSLPTLVQRRLAENGYYQGSIDGQFGPASKSALRRFQAAKGLKQTGMIDEPSLKALGFGDR